MARFSSKVYYKIVEINKQGEFLTLFHGIGGTRVLPIGKTIKAEIKENVMDGKGTSYTSGLHIIDGFENALDYLSRFKRTDRVIVKCKARGLKHKTKSKPYVYLADQIVIVDAGYTKIEK
jgi:hypothetical protein